MESSRRPQIEIAFTLQGIEARELIRLWRLIASFEKTSGFEKTPRFATPSALACSLIAAMLTTDERDTNTLHH